MEIKYLTISSKNQITLNREVRDILDIQSGDKVYFENTPSGVLLKKAEHAHTCPICNGDKNFMNDKCLICDGEGIIKEHLDSKLIVNKLINILLANNININIQPDNTINYIINSKSYINIVSEYIDKCQMFIIRDSLLKFVESKTLIDKETKDRCLALFDNNKNIDEILKTINETQLEVIKSILKEKSSVTEEECTTFVNAFDDKYKSKVSSFLLSFISL